MNIVIGVLVAMSLSGCMISNPLANKADKKTVYQDAQGNRIETNAAGDKTDIKIQGEGGEVSMSGSANGDFTKTGLPKYPNADDSKDGGFFEMTANGSHVIQMSMFTSDPPAKVMAFYEPKIQIQSKSQSNDSYSIVGKVNDREVMITIGSQDGMTTLFIQSQKSASN